MVLIRALLYGNEKVSSSDRSTRHGHVFWPRQRYQFGYERGNFGR